jgi:hypothetical protein
MIKLIVLTVVVILFIILILKIVSLFKNHLEDKKIVTLKKTLGSKKNYYELAGIYKNKIKNSKKQDIMYAKHCRQLADLYYSGSDASGIPSDPVKSIHWYIKAIENGGDLMSLLYLGDIFKNGVQDEVKSNPEFAIKCYKKALAYAKPNDTFLIKEARERIRDFSIEPPSTEVILEQLQTNGEVILEQVQLNGEVINKRGKQINPFIVDPFVNNTWTNFFAAQPQPQPEPNLPVPEPNLPVPEQNVRVNNLRPPQAPGLDINFNDPRDTMRMRPAQVQGHVPVNMADRQVPERPGEIRNDSQNAHDTVLLRGARETIRKLQDTTPIAIDSTQMLNDLRQKINDIGDHTRKFKAISVLDKIETNDIPMANMNELREVDILNLVYNRMHAPVNHGRTTDLLDVLIDQLCDGHGVNTPVCATGRATRVLSSLDAADAKADDIVTLKPKWAIKQELLNKAPKIREKMLEARGATFSEMFNKSTHNDDEERSVNEFIEEFKKTLRNEYKKDYVDTGLLTPTDLEIELKEWIDHI